MPDKQKSLIKKLRNENKKFNMENRQLRKERDHFKGKFEELWNATENIMEEIQKLKDCIESTQTGIDNLEIVSLALSPIFTIE